MSKKINLVGQRFGMLEVVSFERMGSNGKEYRCKCDCGNEKVYRTDTLRSGLVKACGCQRIKALRDNCHINYNPTHLHTREVVEKRKKFNRLGAEKKIGERFNRLTIVSVKRCHRHYQMICKCDCGKMTHPVYADLVNGKVKSCGCHQKEMASITGSNVGYKNALGIGKWWFNKNGKRIRMRSGYEIMFAEILERRGVEWVYEPKIFKLKDGMRYKPDFFLPKTKEWFEVKGYFTEKAKAKVEEFGRQGNNISIIRGKDLEKEHPLSYRMFLKQYRANANRI